MAAMPEGIAAMVFALEVSSIGLGTKKIKEPSLA
jgi:hypothetical protein